MAPNAIQPRALEKSLKKKKKEAEDKQNAEATA